MRSDQFRAAVEALDLDATMASLSPRVRLHSPIGDEPFEGRDAVRVLFAILFRTFVDLRFVATYVSDDGAELLHFRWRLGERQVEGVDMMRFDADGLIEDYRVMIRPLPAVLALREAVWSQLPK